MTDGAPTTGAPTSSPSTASAPAEHGLSARPGAGASADPVLGGGGTVSFVVVGAEDAPVCVDGVCAVPVEQASPSAAASVDAAP